MSPALIALLPFIGALLPGLLIRSGRSVAATACGTTTLIALIGLVLHIPAILRGEVITARFEWLPLIQLNANFRIDGLSLLFGILILGIGMLIIGYARFYLSRQDSIGKFYTYLMLFQGAMIGLV